MKYFLFATLGTLLMIWPSSQASAQYSTSDVDISTYPYKGKTYHTITLNRSKKRVKAKYFAYKDGNTTVYDRYKKWKVGRDIILVSSGTYMDYYNQTKPDGLTIDNGIPINRKLNDFGALVVVYATGGVVVADIMNENINMRCGSQYESFNLQNSYERSKFIDCAQDVEATTFQTHLLVFEDELKIYSNSSPAKRERRFLAACYYGDQLYHVIVYVSEYVTLLDATREVYDFLKQGREYDEVVFMVNLDTGMQDVFNVYDTQGNAYDYPKGPLELSKAVNLLVYYYE